MANFVPSTKDNIHEIIFQTVTVDGGNDSQSICKLSFHCSFLRTSRFPVVRDLSYTSTWTLPCLRYCRPICNAVFTRSDCRGDRSGQLVVPTIAATTASCKHSINHPKANCRTGAEHVKHVRSTTASGRQTARCWSRQCHRGGGWRVVNVGGRQISSADQSTASCGQNIEYGGGWQQFATSAAQDQLRCHRYRRRFVTDT